MPVCQFIVDTALRKLGVVGAGRSARPSDATDCLASLQAMYGAWIAGGAFGRLYDVIPTGSVYTASGNERIIRQDVATLTVELPEYISDGYYEDYGHTRHGYYGTTITVTTEGDQTIVDVKASQPVGYVTTPRDGSAVIISDMVSGNTASWLYDGTVKKWQSIDLLTLADDAPRSDADPQGLAAMLAVEISDQFDSQVSDATLMQANRYKMAMTQRWGMRREVVQGIYC